jgi:hypothetical protein
MPVTSHQISGMMAGQQAMFGNMATYAQQISPYGQQGMPTYSGVNMGGIPPTALPGAYEYNQGMGAAPGMLNAMGTFGAPMLAGAGMMMGGPIGGMLDPFTGAMRGMGAGVGWQSGAGIMSNLGNVARGGLGGIARGIGLGALGALPGLAIGGAIQYGAGQMIQGAQFQNQVGGFLQNNFRFTNPASATGYGFGQTGQRQIGRMFQEMGAEDIMTTPQELLGIAQRGTQMGVFRAVRDAREFKEKFTQMKDSLKEIASVFNTTLADAMPFFQSARQQGFWTPQDITRHANQVRSMQANTGMSSQAAMQSTMMGAQMVRAIGGTGQQGATMMARTQALTGAALYGGTVSNQMLGEAGFGTGAEGAQNLGNMLAGVTTRFARSRVGRWALASMMNQEGTGLDQGRLSEFMAGGMSVGRMGALARRNVSGGRAYDFVGNEEALRGQLAEQGPMAGLGFLRGILGGRLYSGSGRDQLIANRLIRRYAGGNRRQAEVIKRMMQEMPRTMEVQAARTQTSLDAQERQQEQAMNDTWEGMKRKIGSWWERNVTSPIQKAGADIAQQAGRAWSRFSDRLWGTGGRGMRLQDSAVRAMSTAALTGDMSGLNVEFGRSGGVAQQLLSGGLTGGGGVGLERAGTMEAMGFQAQGLTQGGGILGAFGMDTRVQFKEADRRRFGAMMGAMQGRMGTAEAEAMGYGTTEAAIAAKGGAGARQIEQYMQGGLALQMRGAMGKDISNAETMRLARAHVRMIRAGVAGEEAKRTLTGVDEQTAITRLMAMQGGAAGKFSGLRIKAEGGLFADKTMAQLEEMQNVTMDAMVTKMRGGISDDPVTQAVLGNVTDALGGLKGVAVTGEGLRELKDDPNAGRAFRLMAEARDETDPDKKEELKKEARKALQNAGQDTGGTLSDAAKSAAIRLARGDDPSLDDQMAIIGSIQQAANTKELSKTIAKRMSRVRSRLGDKGLDRINKIAKEVKGGALQRALDSVLNPPPNETAGDRITKMRELAKLAAENPEQAARMRGTLVRAGAGDTEIGLLMTGAMETAADIKRGAVTEEDEERLRAGRGGRAMRRAQRGVGSLLGRMGLLSGMKRGDVGRLIRGDEDAQKRLREKLEDRLGMSADKANEFLKDLTGGLTKEELLKRSTAATTAAGVRSYSERVAKEAGLKPDVLKLSGKEGSPQEMGKEMKIQTALLRDSNIALNRMAKRESGVVRQDKPK